VVTRRQEGGSRDEEPEQGEVVGDEAGGTLAENLIAGKAVEIGCGRVGIHDAALGVEQQDGKGRAVEDRAVAQVTLELYSGTAGPFGSIAHGQYGDLAAIPGAIADTYFDGNVASVGPAVEAQGDVVAVQTQEVACDRRTRHQIADRAALQIAHGIAIELRRTRIGPQDAEVPQSTMSMASAAASKMFSTSSRASWATMSALLRARSARIDTDSSVHTESHSPRAASKRPRTRK
jgi:hypothetical protein